jgi:hypothetical protein
MAIEKFLENNPWSSLEEREAGKCIQNPWGDSTLNLELNGLSAPS